MREFIKSLDVLEAIDQYRSEIKAEMKGRNLDFRLHHQLEALKNLENRIKLLGRGEGLRVIQGGKQKERKEQ